MTDLTTDLNIKNQQNESKHFPSMKQEYANPPSFATAHFNTKSVEMRTMAKSLSQFSLYFIDGVQHTWISQT